MTVPSAEKVSPPRGSPLRLVCRTDQLGSHLRRALDNGLSKDELVHAITHLAFYAGWPCAMTAVTQLKQITEG